jgi:hypothetical protein
VGAVFTGDGVEGSGGSLGVVVGGDGVGELRFAVHFVVEVGGFHAGAAELAPATHGEVVDEGFFEGVGGLEGGAESVEERGETARIFTGDKDGFGEQAVGVAFVGCFALDIGSSCGESGGT